MRSLRFGTTGALLNAEAYTTPRVAEDICKAFILAVTALDTVQDRNKLHSNSTAEINGDKGDLQLQTLLRNQPRRCASLLSRHLPIVKRSSATLDRSHIDLLPRLAASHRAYPRVTTCEAHRSCFRQNCVCCCLHDLVTQVVGMRALALWGVCPETGPACFSGRSAPACSCFSARPARQRRLSGSISRQTPFLSDDRHQRHPSDTARVRAGSVDLDASFDWEGERPSFDWDETDEGPSANTKQGPDEQAKTRDKSFFAPVKQSQQNQPLKINRDLLLVQPRLCLSSSQSAPHRSNSSLCAACSSVHAEPVPLPGGQAAIS